MNMTPFGGGRGTFSSWVPLGVAFGSGYLYTRSRIVLVCQGESSVQTNGTTTHWNSMYQVFGGDCQSKVDI